MAGIIPEGDICSRWHHPDILPTLAAITGASLPRTIDGVNIFPDEGDKSISQN
jgi:arylsulfatase A-like enzyme